MDEAGDLRFPGKTRYYIFSVVWTYDPAPLAHTLTNLRFGLNKAGYAVHEFHANPDPSPRRELVLNALTAYPLWSHAAVVVEKSKVYHALRDPQRFYPRFAEMPLHLVLRHRLLPGTSQVMVYTSLMPVSGKPRENMEAAIRIACRKYLAVQIPFHLFHHPNASNAWLQVADYCAWAIQRKWEASSLEAYNILLPRLAAPELDVLRHAP